MSKNEVDGNWDKYWAPLYLEQVRENTVRDQGASLVTQGRRGSAGGQESGTRSPATYVNKISVQSMLEKLRGTSTREEMNI